MIKKGISAVVIIAFAISLIGYVQCDTASRADNVKTFTAFFSSYGEERNEDNDIKNIIAKKIGAKCDETWLSGQTTDDAINSFIANGNYPDFISGSSELYEANALIPIDEYWDEYPNIVNYLSPKEWNRLRQSDGHIYWIPQFGVIAGEDTETIHEGEAFWIQTRVLKWANYPDIRTLDEYFALLESYYEKNPEMEDGTPNIPFTILCDDWRYFCLENPPQFLDGYPNDGSCMVDPNTKKVLDYNISPTAKQYFGKLNEEYKKGIVDPESFTSTYEEYLSKLSTGAVLGMVDQWWDFAYDITKPQGVGTGYSYVPLPITISREVKNQWHIKRSNEFDVGSGISITTRCDDIDGAMKFISDMLDDEIMKLRYWGQENVDYCVDENGGFYFDSEQSQFRNSPESNASHFCTYSYFPRHEGMMPDGINAYIPEYQKHEMSENVAPDVRECLDAYGCESYVDMIGSNEAPGDWYPMYSYSDQLTYSTEPGRVWKEMTELKHAWLPQVVMADNFEETWGGYLSVYNELKPEIFFNDMQNELERRLQQD